jgi:hypothetical protein
LHSHRLGPASIDDLDLGLAVTKLKYAKPWAPELRGGDEVGGRAGGGGCAVVMSPALQINPYLYPEYFRKLLGSRLLIAIRYF